MASAFGKGIGEYRKTSVQSATPLQLVIMLYDAALRHCEAGKAAVIKGDLSAQNKHLNSAQRIVSELVAGLDMTKGAEIAKNLFGIYTFCLNELATANIHDKTAPIDKVVKILTELRQAWSQIEGEQNG